MDEPLEIAMAGTAARSGVLRLGISIKSEQIDRYTAELLHFCLEQESLADVYLLIVPDAPEKSARVKLWLWNLVLWEERKYILHRPQFREHLATSEASRLIGARVIFADTSGLEVVSSLKLDLILQLGGSAPHIGLAKLARLGGVSFGDADVEGMPLDLAGFCACHYELPKTGYALRAIVDRHEDAVVFARGYYSTRSRFLLNQAELRFKAQAPLKQWLLRVAREGKLPTPLAKKQQPILRRQVGLPLLLRYACKLAVRKLSDKIYKQYLKRTEVWEVSFVRENWKKAHKAPRITPKVPAGHFWADPFLWHVNGRNYCFLEDYAYDRKLGHISVMEICDSGFVELGPCLVEPFHLSFPYLFSYKEQVYMCPETSQAGEIRVYQCDEFPLKWSLVAVLMKQVSAADTMLFEWEGRWWMLTNIDQTGSGDHCSELQLYYSDSPLSNDWIQHPLNPIAVDSEGARNGGLFFENGAIYRVGQRQGYCNYGEGLIVYRVLRLSPSEYEEVEVQRMDPRQGEGISGTHHLSTLNGITVFDHKSWRHAGKTNTLGER